MRAILAGAFSKRTGQPPIETVPGKALWWLILSFVLLLIPQWDRLPWWLIVACAVLAGWRWLAQKNRLKLPGRLLRAGIMFVLTAVYLATVQGRFTVDTAASFFVLAVGLKWLETRSARDFYVLFFIQVYLGAVNFLFKQDIGWTLLTFGSHWLPPGGFADSKCTGSPWWL